MTVTRAEIESWLKDASDEVRKMPDTWAKGLLSRQLVMIAQGVKLRRAADLPDPGTPRH